MLLPFGYLARRASEGGLDRWQEALSSSTLDLLQNSALLGTTVGVLSIGLALPAAWLTVRAQLPGRRAWAVLLALPLAIPSYLVGMTVVSALGPRGILQ